jgi:hypothetical protein
MLIKITHHFFGNACTKSRPLRFSQFSGCYYAYKNNHIDDVEISREKKIRSVCWWIWWTQARKILDTPFEGIHCGLLLKILFIYICTRLGKTYISDWLFGVYRLVANISCIFMSTTSLTISNIYVEKRME